MGSWEGGEVEVGRWVGGEVGRWEWRGGGDGRVRGGLGEGRGVNCYCY